MELVNHVPLRWGSGIGFSGVILACRVGDLEEMGLTSTVGANEYVDAGIKCHVKMFERGETIYHNAGQRSLQLSKSPF